MKITVESWFGKNYGYAVAYFKANKWRFYENSTYNVKSLEEKQELIEEVRLEKKVARENIKLVDFQTIECREIEVPETLDVEFNWFKDMDNKDNTMWILLSPYHDDGTPLEFRLSQEIRDDQIMWHSTFDEELGGNMDIAENDLEAAKRQIEQCYENCLTAIAGDC